MVASLGQKVAAPVVSQLKKQRVAWGNNLANSFLGHSIGTPDSEQVFADHCREPWGWVTHPRRRRWRKLAHLPSRSRPSSGPFHRYFTHARRSPQRSHPADQDDDAPRAKRSPFDLPTRGGNRRLSTDAGGLLSDWWVARVSSPMATHPSRRAPANFSELGAPRVS